MSDYDSDSDSGLSDADISRIRSMLFKAKAHYIQKGFPPRTAYEKAVQDVYEKTGEDVSQLWGCGDRNDYEEYTGFEGNTGGRGGEDYSGRAAGYARGGGVGGSRGRRRNPWADLYEEFFGEAPDLSQTRAAQETRRAAGEPEARYTSSTRYAESPRYTSSSRGAERPRTQSAGTDYDRMFQNGNDLNASRTSGKILSEDAIHERSWQITRDLLAKGANADYARQQGKKFKIREMGKRARAGYLNEKEEEDMHEQPRERRGGGRQAEWDDEGRADHGQSSRSRAQNAYEEPSRQEWYNAARSYPEQEFRRITKQIYEEWLEKGAHPEEARREAKKWYARNKSCGTGSSSRRSGFDSFSDMRESLDEEDSCPRRSHSERNTHGAGSSSRPSYPNNRGYRTEERRPGEFANGKNNGYNDGNGWSGREAVPSGVKPDEDLYKLLGVSDSATIDEIRKAHRKLCITHHPDRVQGGPTAKKRATEKMAQMNQACDVLMDEDMRAFYDRTGLIASVGESPDA